MNRSVRPSSRCSSRSRLRICAWIETSSADTGSSAINSFGPQRERARDPDPLALAAGELVRVAVVVLGVQADRSAAAPHGAPAPRAVALEPWIANGSPTIEPTVLRGFSDE